MTSPSNPHIAGLRKSGGAGIHKPFRSPLRASGTENTNLKRRLGAASAPDLQSNTMCEKKRILSTTDHTSKEVPGKEISDSAERNLKEPSCNTTPGKSVISSNFRGRPTCSTSSRPFSTPFRNPATKGQFSTPFRSPVCNDKVPQKSLSKEDELNCLIRREEELDKEISSLKDLGLEVEELQGHIKNLHEYNEIKDAAQIVLGRLAELEGVTVKEMHDKYGVTVLD